MKPKNQWQAGGLAGGISTIAVWLLGECGVEVPAEVAAALATVIAFAVAYVVPTEAAAPQKEKE